MFIICGSSVHEYIQYVHCTQTPKIPPLHAYRYGECHWQPKGVSLNELC